MKKGYKIDFSANTVIINKNFEQAAQCLNTPEFKLCREFRRNGADDCQTRENGDEKP